MEAKELEFVQKESEGSGWKPTKWIEQNIYLDIHEILFVKFPTLLYEWLSRLKTQKNNFQGGEPTKWNLFLIERLKRINNPISRVVYLWVDSIIEGYITEFVVNKVTSYSEAERIFFQGLCI